MRLLNCVPAKELTALLKSLAVVIRCRSRFLHLARRFLNQIYGRYHIST